MQYIPNLGPFDWVESFSFLLMESKHNQQRWPHCFYHWPWICLLGPKKEKNTTGLMLQPRLAEIVNQCLPPEFRFGAFHMNRGRDCYGWWDEEHFLGWVQTTNQIFGSKKRKVLQRCCRWCFLNSFQLYYLFRWKSWRKHPFHSR